MSEQKFYYVYIMASRSLNLYIGISSKLKERVWKHKNGVFEGFTSRYRIERLVYFERYVTVQKAIAREKQLKRWIRSKKIALIEIQNPTWQDLSEEWYEQTADPSTRARKDWPRTRSG
ncbi:MAG TPA: GIY-YIG nuclease family protein [Terriglobales bacterium]